MTTQTTTTQRTTVQILVTVTVDDHEATASGINPEDLAQMHVEAALNSFTSNYDACQTASVEVA